MFDRMKIIRSTLDTPQQTPLPAPEPGLAVVIGAGGGIGSALLRQIAEAPGSQVTLGLSRSSDPPIDLLDESSIAAAAQTLGRRGEPLRLLVIATGFLHDGRFSPERRLEELQRDHLMHAFAVNSIGPALVLRHFAPLLPKQGRCVVAAISAKVGSIGDNHLGGWYGYRASKAALNQLIRTASIELRRRCPDSICVALHPGTVDTRLSAPFSRRGLETRAADEAARLLNDVLARLEPGDSGGFFDYRGNPLPW
jgi:NAD(P)-dependent dehydrogenase (short-subunit alcohol dehydrogenase family)